MNVTRQFVKNVAQFVFNVSAMLLSVFWWVDGWMDGRVRPKQADNECHLLLPKIA
jgi:hypothetical protein